MPEILPKKTTEDTKRPDVQKYCLISAANSYTDFHIDFGGKSNLLKIWQRITI